MSSSMDVSKLKWAVTPGLLANDNLLIDQAGKLGLDFRSEILPQIENVLKDDLKPITIFGRSEHEHLDSSHKFNLITYDMASIITWEIIKKSRITKSSILQLPQGESVFQEHLDHRITLDELEKIIALIEQNLRNLSQSLEYKKVKARIHRSIRAAELNKLVTPIFKAMLKKIKIINTDAYNILADPKTQQQWHTIVLNQYNYRQSSNYFNYKLDQRLRQLCKPFTTDKQPLVESLTFNIQEALSQQKYYLINAAEALSNLCKLTNTGSSLKYLGPCKKTGNDEYLLSINQPTPEEEHQTLTTTSQTPNNRAPYKILKQLAHFKRCGYTLDFDLKKWVDLTEPNKHMEFDFNRISIEDGKRIYQHPQRPTKKSGLYLLIQWKEFTNFRNFAQSCFPDDLPQLINKACEIFPHHQGLKALTNLDIHFNQGILFIIKTYLQETILHLPEEQLEQFLVKTNNYLQDPAQSISNKLYNKLETLCAEFGIQEHTEELARALHKPNAWNAYLEQLSKKQKDKLKRQLPISKYHQTFEHLNTCYDELQTLCDQDAQYQAIDAEIDYEIKTPLLQPSLSIQPDQNQIISTGLHIKCHILELSEILAKQLSKEVYSKLLLSNTINHKLIAIFGAKEQLHHFIQNLIQKICELENTSSIREITEESLKMAIPPHQHATNYSQEDITEITEAILNGLRCSDTPLENIIQQNTPSYLKIILELKKQLQQFNAVNLAGDEPIKSLAPLLAVEKLLTNQNNQALFRRNHHVWEKADQLIKTLRTVIISIAIVPFIAACAIYIFKPKINGHRYKNFKSIWSGIKNMGFTNNTRRKDCVLSLNAFFDHFRQPNQHNQHNLEASINT
jgi:hypothetical protein